MLKIEEIKKIEVEKCSKCGKLYVKEDENNNKCKECERRCL